MCGIMPQTLDGILSSALNKRAQQALEKCLMCACSFHTGCHHSINKPMWWKPTGEGNGLAYHEGGEDYWGKAETHRRLPRAQRCKCTCRHLARKLCHLHPDNEGMRNYYARQEAAAREAAAREAVARSAAAREASKERVLSGQAEAAGPISAAEREWLHADVHELRQLAAERNILKNQLLLLESLDELLEEITEAKFYSSSDLSCTPVLEVERENEWENSSASEQCCWVEDVDESAPCLSPGGEVEEYGEGWEELVSTDEV